MINNRTTMLAWKMSAMLLMHKKQGTNRFSHGALREAFWGGDNMIEWQGANDAFLHTGIEGRFFWGGEGNNSFKK